MPDAILLLAAIGLGSLTWRYKENRLISAIVLATAVFVLAATAVWLYQNSVESVMGIKVMPRELVL